MPVPRKTDFIDKIFNETLDRLRGGVADEGWWQRICDGLGHAFVAPDFFRIDLGAVVHPFPIHKLCSFMEREAELNEYRDLVVSTLAFARMLHDGGYIDSESYIRSHT